MIKLLTFHQILLLSPLLNRIKKKTKKKKHSQLKRRLKKYKRKKRTKKRQRKKKKRKISKIASLLDFCNLQDGSWQKDVLRPNEN